MGGNLFTHAMSEAEVQAHEVRLKQKGNLSLFTFQFSP